MENDAGRTISIAAALINDSTGRLLLVRKTGSRWFMQAGGKIEPGESPRDALRRELNEEIGWSSSDDAAIRYLGHFTAPAANEPDQIVAAEVFHVRMRCLPMPGQEIEQAVWVDYAAAVAMSLAPLTRDCILPLSLRL